MKVYELDQIKDALAGLDMVTAMEEGFIEYSKGNVVVPPVGELIFDEPPGDVHIKYGYIKNDDVYVIKIASGFFKNTDWVVCQIESVLDSGSECFTADGKRSSFSISAEPHVFIRLNFR